MTGTVRAGTAGWAIGRAAASAFPADGSGLERYSHVLPVAEINSSFHRPHRTATWERWRDSVPPDFRFSVKIPKTITHERKLADCGELVREFMAQADLLGPKLAVLLVQLPPKLAFDADVARTFFAELREQSDAVVVVEPRHLSWFEADPESLLKDLRVGRVAADPAISPAAAVPGGWPGIAYWRLHGSPVTYRSSYQDRIPALAEQIAGDAARERWCIFDNTASSAAILDALSLQERLRGA